MLNLTKNYADLLDLIGLNGPQINESLRRIFNRDVQENNNFKFLTKVIRPIKVDGQPSLDTVFLHLTTKRVEVKDGRKTYKRAEFDSDRSVRLHWLRHHIDRGETEEVEIFSVTERDYVSRKDVVNTYIYNIEKQYVIVLRPQNSELDYYLLSAYYLNEKWAIGAMETRMNKRLAKVY